MKQFWTILKALLKSKYNLGAIFGKKRARSAPPPNAYYPPEQVYSDGAVYVYPADYGAPPPDSYRLAPPVSAPPRDNSQILYIILAVVFIPVIALLCAAAAVVAPSAAENGALPDMSLTLYAAVAVMTLVTGIVGMLTYIYLNRDAEFLASLPVPGWKIFIAKLTVVYVGELAVSVVALLPLGITVGFAARLGAGYFLSVILAVFFVPALPLLAASVISVPLMYAASFFRRKNLASSLVILFVASAAFALYYFGFSSLQSGGDSDGALPDAFSALGNSAAARVALYPIYLLVRFGMNLPALGLPAGAGTSALALLCATLTMAAALFAAGAISALVYRKAAAAQFEGGRGKAGRRGALPASSGGVMRALIAKEWRAVTRETAFAFQCLFPEIISLILAVFLSLQLKKAIDSPDINGALQNAGIGGANISGNLAFIFSAAMFAVVTMMTSGGALASTAITREGKNFFLMKTAPVPYATQVRAKLFLSVSLTAPFAVAGIVAGSVIMGVPALEAALQGAFAAAYNYIFACVALRMDINRPKLDWVTPTQAVKNSRNVIIPFLINLALSVGIITVAAVIGLFLYPAAAWGVLLAAAVVALPFTRKFLLKNLDCAFDAIET